MNRALAILVPLACAFAGNLCFADTDPFDYRYEHLNVSSHPKVSDNGLLPKT
jgi:hypothetical protein